MKDNYFVQRNLSATFHEDGYVVVDLLSDDEIQYCKDCYLNTEKELKKTVDSNRYNSLEIENYTYRSNVYNSLAPYLQEKINRFVKKFQIIGINFAIKKAQGEEFEPHVDDSHTNNNHIGINVWIPLTDVNPENGSLYLFKGTHQIDIPMRGIGLPFPYLKHIDYIKQHTKPLTLKKGQAVIFNDKILHGSGKNNTFNDRAAIIVGMIPQEASPEVFVRYKDLGHGRAELFEAPPEFFFKFNFEKRPNGFKSFGIFDYIPTIIDENKFKQLISSH